MLLVMVYDEADLYCSNYKKEQRWLVGKSQNISRGDILSMYDLEGACSFGELL